MGYLLKRILWGKEAMIILIILGFALIYAGFRLGYGQLSKLGLLLFILNALRSAIMKA